MLHLDLQLKPQIEKKFLQIVTEKYNGSYEKFIENIIVKQENALTKLIDISEDLGIDDLAKNHDHYLYGTPKGTNTISYFL